MAAVTNVANVAHRDLLQIAATVATEKGIERETVIEALEQAIQSAAVKKYGELDIRVEIDRTSGAVALLLYREVIADDVELQSGLHITLEEARRKNPVAEVGDFITEDLPPVEFGRI